VIFERGHQATCRVNSTEQQKQTDKDYQQKAKKQLVACS